MAGAASQPVALWAVGSLAAGPPRRLCGLSIHLAAEFNALGRRRRVEQGVLYTVRVVIASRAPVAMSLPTVGKKRIDCDASDVR